MTIDEMRDAIAALKRDLAEVVEDLAEVQSRVRELEQARDVEHAKRGRGTSRFQSGYSHGLGKGHE